MIGELGGTMTKRAVILGCLAFFAAAGLRADFSYDQSSKMTGGMMAGMMKVAADCVDGIGEGRQDGTH
jgi:hypothetical protein